jgi:hypothetical protein
LAKTEKVFLYKKYTKTMRRQILILLIALSTNALGQIGQFATAQDIGSPKITGSSTYDSSSQSYTLKGGGANIWFNHDEFHFLYRKIKGDFSLTANFLLVGNQNGNGHRKTGWMIRESPDHDAISINSCLHGDGLVVLQWRLLRGAYMRDPEEEVFFPKQYFGEKVIQLERIGQNITMRIANPGEPLEDMGSINIPHLRDELLIGPYALAHDPNGLQEAKVWNVRITRPIPPNWHPNRLVRTQSYDNVKLSSRIEIADVATGITKILHESTDPITDAQFDKNGKEVWFKKAGAWQKIDSHTGIITLSNQQPANVIDNTIGEVSYYADSKSSTHQLWKRTKNNNVAEQLTYDIDHAYQPQLSPDKKTLAYLTMPHTSNPKAQVKYQNCQIKLLPLGGGSSRILTYFYGGKGSFDAPAWSPNGKQIVYISSGL